MEAKQTYLPCASYTSSPCYRSRGVPMFNFVLAKNYQAWHNIKRHSKNACHQVLDQHK